MNLAWELWILHDHAVFMSVAKGIAGKESVWMLLECGYLAQILSKCSLLVVAEGCCHSCDAECHCNAPTCPTISPISSKLLLIAIFGLSVCFL
jgi:hypothetical protein